MLQGVAPNPLWVRIPPGTLDSFTSGSYQASLWNVGGSTQVPTHASDNAQRGIRCPSPPVKMESRRTVLVRRENQHTFVFPVLIK